MTQRWSLVLLVCCCCFALALGLPSMSAWKRAGNFVQRPTRSVARSARPNSNALWCAASSNEGPPPPYLEAYGYARDTENRLANQIAIGVATFQATASEAKDLLEKTSKDNTELLEKTVQDTKELVGKTVQDNKELVEKTVQRQNLIIFLGFASLAMLASMQPEIRGFFSFFLSKIKLV